MLGAKRKKACDYRKPLCGLGTDANDENVLEMTVLGHILFSPMDTAATCI